MNEWFGNSGQIGKWLVFRYQPSYANPLDTGYIQHIFIYRLCDMQGVGKIKWDWGGKSKPL